MYFIYSFLTRICLICAGVVCWRNKKAVWQRQNHRVHFSSPRADLPGFSWQIPNFCQDYFAQRHSLEWSVQIPVQTYRSCWCHQSWQTFWQALCPLPVPWPKISWMAEKVIWQIFMIQTYSFTENVCFHVSYEEFDILHFKYMILC